MKFPRRNRRLLFTVFVVLWIGAITATVFATRAAIRNEKYERANALTDGNAANGLYAMERYGCAACHIIPGLARTGPGPAIGPSLHNISTRDSVAGSIKNDPKNLVRWIINPIAMNPKTAMPNVGVTEADARDIVAYLYATD